MKKRYHINQLTDKKCAAEILREVKEIEGVREAAIMNDLTCLELEAVDDGFSMIMDKTVNICKRISQGCELTYMFH